MIGTNENTQQNEFALKNVVLSKLKWFVGCISCDEILDGVRKPALPSYS